jgi:hypothetical protein
MAAPRVKTKYPGIYKRGSRYSFPYTDPQGRQRWGSARTLAEAREAKAAMTADVTRGEYRVMSKTTFGDYAGEWGRTYTGRTRRGVRSETMVDYRRALGIDSDGNATGSGAVAYFGRMRLTEIEPQHGPGLRVAVPVAVGMPEDEHRQPGGDRNRGEDTDEGRGGCKEGRNRQVGRGRSEAGLPDRQHH